MSFLRVGCLRGIAIAATITLYCAASPLPAWAQAQPAPQAAPTTPPGESQAQTQSQLPPGSPPAAAASAQPIAPLDLHGLMAQFGGQLHTAGVKRIAVINGLLPANGPNALEDWLIAQVQRALAEGPNGLEVVLAEQRKGKRNGEVDLYLAAADTVMSASLYPGRDGIQVTLNAVHAKVDRGQNESIAFVSQAVPLTDEMAALLPPEWKKQIEEERGAPRVPPADHSIASKEPWCVYCRNPKYAELARQLRIEGTLRITATVGADGSAHDIQLLKGLGFGLDEAAIEAVCQWRFNPALDKAGKPIATNITIEITMRMF